MGEAPRTERLVLALVSAMQEVVVTTLWLVSAAEAVEEVEVGKL